MSIALHSEVKHLREQLQALQSAYVELSERVLTLEAHREEPGVELDIDTLVPKRGPGRPRKVAS